MGWLIKRACEAEGLPAASLPGSHIRFDSLEFMERRFLDIDIVRCNPDGLVLCEPRKHRDEIDMDVTEHACPKVSVLGAGSRRNT